MTMEIKHGGCAQCGKKEQEILVSTNIPGSVVGLALCDACRQIQLAKTRDV